MLLENSLPVLLMSQSSDVKYFHIGYKDLCNSFLPFGRQISVSFHSFFLSSVYFGCAVELLHLRWCVAGSGDRAPANHSLGW